MPESEKMNEYILIIGTNDNNDKVPEYFNTAHFLLNNLMETADHLVTIFDYSELRLTSSIRRRTALNEFKLTVPVKDEFISIPNVYSLTYYQIFQRAFITLKTSGVQAALEILNNSGLNPDALEDVKAMFEDADGYTTLDDMLNHSAEDVTEADGLSPLWKYLNDQRLPAEISSTTVQAIWIICYTKYNELIWGGRFNQAGKMGRIKPTRSDTLIDYYKNVYNGKPSWTNILSKLNAKCHIKIFGGSVYKIGEEVRDWCLRNLGYYPLELENIKYPDNFALLRNIKFLDLEAIYGENDPFIILLRKLKDFTFRSNSVCSNTFEEIAPKKINFFSDGFNEVPSLSEFVEFVLSVHDISPEKRVLTQKLLKQLAENMLKEWLQKGPVIPSDNSRKFYFRSIAMVLSELTGLSVIAPLIGVDINQETVTGRCMAKHYIWNNALYLFEADKMIVPSQNTPLHFFFKAYFFADNVLIKDEYSVHEQSAMLSKEYWEKIKGRDYYVFNWSRIRGVTIQGLPLDYDYNGTYTSGPGPGIVNLNNCSFPVKKKEDYIFNSINYRQLRNSHGDIKLAGDSEWIKLISSRVIDGIKKILTVHNDILGDEGISLEHVCKMSLCIRKSEYDNETELKLMLKSNTLFNSINSLLENKFPTADPANYPVKSSLFKKTIKECEQMTTDFLKNNMMNTFSIYGLIYRPSLLGGKVFFIKMHTTYPATYPEPIPELTSIDWNALQDKYFSLFDLFFLIDNRGRLHATIHDKQFLSRITNQ